MSDIPGSFSSVLIPAYSREQNNVNTRVNIQDELIQIQAGINCGV